MKKLILAAMAAALSISAFAQTAQKTERIKINTYSSLTNNFTTYSNLVSDVDGNRLSGSMVFRVNDKNVIFFGYVPRGELDNLVHFLENAKEQIEKKPDNDVIFNFESSEGCEVRVEYIKDGGQLLGWQLCVQTDSLSLRTESSVKASNIEKLIKDVRDCMAKIDSFLAGE